MVVRVRCCGYIRVIMKGRSKIELIKIERINYANTFEIVL